MSLHRRRILIATPNQREVVSDRENSQVPENIEFVDNRVSLQEAIQRQKFDILFLDLKMIDGDQELISPIFKELFTTGQARGFALVIMADPASSHQAVKLVEAGADDYLHYPIPYSELELTVEQVFKKRRQEAELEHLRGQQFRPKDKIVHLDSLCSKMQDIYERIRDVAETRSTVLLNGESGVGKGVIARLIHQNSSRRRSQFIHVHCGAIAENLIESELFGHEHGAFTGAVKRKLGKFELANHGTIFLDEVSTLAPSAQVKLLQVLQDGFFQRVGGERDVQVDIRVIAATNEDLFELSEAGKFRKDLLYRLNVFPISVPSLRDRREDIPQFVDRFIADQNRLNQKRIQGIQPETLEGLKKYDWPGNIRELENLIERASIIERSEILTSESFPAEIFSNDETTAVLPLNVQLSLAEARSRMIENFERQYLKEVLTQSGGRINRAAEIAGVGVRQLNKLMNKYGLSRVEFRNCGFKL